MASISSNCDVSSGDNWCWFWNFAKFQWWQILDKSTCICHLDWINLSTPWTAHCFVHCWCTLSHPIPQLFINLGALCALLIGHESSLSLSSAQSSSTILIVLLKALLLFFHLSLNWCQYLVSYNWHILWNLMSPPVIIHPGLALASKVGVALGMPVPPFPISNSHSACRTTCWHSPRAEIDIHDHTYLTIPHTVSTS